MSLFDYHKLVYIIIRDTFSMEELYQVVSSFLYLFFVLIWFASKVAFAGRPPRYTFSNTCAIILHTYVKKLKFVTS